MKIEINTKEIEKKLEKKIKKDIKKDLIQLINKFFDNTLLIDNKPSLKTGISRKEILKKAEKTITIPTKTGGFPKLASMESVQSRAEQLYKILKDVYPLALTFPDIYEKIGISDSSYDIKSSIAYPVNILVNNRLIIKTVKNYNGREVPAYQWKEKQS